MAARLALWSAMALDAAVRRADATCGYYLLSERFTGPVHADGSIVCGDACLRSEVSQASIVQIDCLNGVAVFLLHVLQQRRDTLANLTLEEFIGFLVILQMRDELFGNAFRRSTLAVMIDDGVTKDAIEPGHDAFLVADRSTLFKAAHESRLQDVFRGGLGLDSLLQKRQELLTSFDKSVDGFGGPATSTAPIRSAAR